MTEELVVSLDSDADEAPRRRDEVKQKALAYAEEKEVKTRLNVVRLIFYELTAGVGAWGALRPLIAAALALVPFFFLGQHFNRQHRKAADWFFLQIPLILAVVLWPMLWLWSIIDAYQVAMFDVAEDASESLA